MIVNNRTYDNSLTLFCSLIHAHNMDMCLHCVACTVVMLTRMEQHHTAKRRWVLRETQIEIVVK